jgi:spoIIIJ-associated protein
MNEIEIEGKTVESAIKEGLEKLGVARDSVDIKILNEGTSGLFGLMGNKPARVRLVLRNGAAHTCVKPEIEPDYKLAQSRAKEITGNLLKHMQIAYNDINTSLMAGRVLAQINSPDSNLIIGKNGQTLEALDLVLNLMLSKDPLTRVKVSLDVEGYRHRQEERLQGIALKAIEQALTSKKPYIFDPMPARERRILHMTLKSHPEVDAYSEGEGPSRRVVIKPKAAI